MQKKIIYLANIKQPSAIISAEIGTILNSIRSSLDVLITSVATRHGISNLEDAYFPLAKTEADFLRLNYKGSEVIRQFPNSDQNIIASFKPWRGGNRLLVALHDMDILRKHQRLISVKALPNMISLSPDAFRNGLQFISMWGGFQDDAVLASTHIDADSVDIHLSLDIVFNEVGAASGKGVVDALRDFANLADSIIWAFDIP